MAMLNESVESLDENKLECSRFQEVTENKNSDQILKADKMKCVCEKDEQATFYCQDCRLYLCSTCSDYHTKFPAMKDHRPKEVSKVLPCMIHNEHLEFYCIECKIPVCEECTQTDHRDTRGKHKAITIQEAFQNFQESASDLEERANVLTAQLKKGLKKVHNNVKKLEECKDTCLTHIDKSVEELTTKINEKGDEIKNKVETIYKKKKKVNKTQIDELTKKISNVEKSLSDVNQLIKSDKITAMKSSNMVYKALKENLLESPRAEPNDDGQIHFFKNRSLLQIEYDIGNVTETMANHLALIGGDVTQGQPIVVKVCKTDEYEIDANHLSATWRQPTGKTIITQVEEDGNGYLVVTGECKSTGVCTLDVSIDVKPIRQSPMRKRRQD
ncbi:transcription intermediary factor 1-beta-like [Anneissia japonica]|uniref:transcription intermediary factor 1-beta-like n=1 Tax=Anneissia japonica TaxID=1529436 RepID=UPI00142568D1|nr:transcription intermediary factor 1-beta-like [Anneissia japonica]